MLAVAPLAALRTDAPSLHRIVEGRRRIVGKVGQGRWPELRGVVHQDVDPLVPIQRQRHEPIEIARRPQVDRNRCVGRPHPSCPQ